MYVASWHTQSHHFPRRKGQSLHSKATLAIISFSLLTSLLYTALQWTSGLTSLSLQLQLPGAKTDIAERIKISSALFHLSMLWLSTFPVRLQLV